MKVYNILQIMTNETYVAFSMNLGGIWWKSQSVKASKIEPFLLNLEVDCMFLGNEHDEYNILIQLKDNQLVK